MLNFISYILSRSIVFMSDYTRIAKNDRVIRNITINI